ncbi:Ferredoxin--NADP reductase 2 [Listeria grayi]|uniref:Ferredoxin--NADP reductase n=3 Tax=Listeria grayi TaxID=1641 RepID=D7UYA9_LISGR|nr:NAD(P)/FAD-dependent oxidoreductase [Listeria grayi]EFI83896.1 pyridine nucleotide-disulfide oxidoreductase [Listeria grayi DSM 20601]EUJ25914.1 ferredoxin--NADP reductase [Listeria grayi FSL F6-1183]MBC1923068.1 NAD(P)/FAD-dependent oxidoreductase [Listeria grayi]STY44248.1 Ferredoxin--NADP reductase 2 [Listeria grayi]VEI36027.1 Ferredoxin--NADP reductase 2 [Listeria grayi]
MDDTTKIYDITIIGGGPVGLFAAFYAGMRKASVKIIESLPQLGGQLSTLYPEKYIYDIPGFPAVRAQELVNNLTEQMQPFDPTVCLGEAVQAVEKQADGTFEITTETDIHYSKSIIITAGNGAFQPRRLELEEAKQYEGKNLHYFINDLSRFSGRRVAVCGGGDSAVDWALMLEPIAAEVSIIHRRNAFRAHEHSVSNLEKSNVKIMTPFIPTSIVGDESGLSAIALDEVKGDKKELLEVDDFIINYGFVSSLGPIKDFGLDLERNSIVVNSKMETNIPGIYSAGDICTYDGKVKLIATGFGEAPTAVNNAMHFIDPKARVQPMHSSSLFDQDK